MRNSPKEIPDDSSSSFPYRIQFIYTTKEAHNMLDVPIRLNQNLHPIKKLYPFYLRYNAGKQSQTYSRGQRNQLELEQ